MSMKYILCFIQNLLSANQSIDEIVTNATWLYWEVEEREIWFPKTKILWRSEDKVYNGRIIWLWSAYFMVAKSQNEHPPFVVTLIQGGPQGGNKSTPFDRNEVMCKIRHSFHRWWFICDHHRRSLCTPPTEWYWSCPVHSSLAQNNNTNHFREL